MNSNLVNSKFKYAFLLYMHQRYKLEEFRSGIFVYLLISREFW